MATAQKSRTTTTTRRTPSSRASGGTAAKRPTNERLPYDVAIVFLLTTALILLATLIWPAGNGENFIGTTVIRGLRLVVGDGVWAFPLVLFFSGWMLAMQRGRSWDNIGGALALFFLFISWWHLGHAPVTAHFATDNLLHYGGYVGAAASWLARSAFGTVGGHIVFGALAVVAFLFLTDTPLTRLLTPVDWLISNFVGFTQAGGRAVANGAREAAARQVEKAAERQEERKAARVTAPDPAPAQASSEERPRPRLFSLKRESEPEPVVAPFTPTPEPVVETPRATGRVFSRRTPEPVLPPEPPAPSNEPNEKLVPAKPAVRENRPAPTARPTFALPPLSILQAPQPKVEIKAGESEERREVLIQTLEDFGIGADIENVAYGPTITRYEVALERGIKVSKIVSLADNLAMALAAIDVRIEAPIPGKSAIGIEVPNAKPTLVTLRECIERPEFVNAPGRLTFALGRDVTGVCRYADLAKMPHLLIGGSTGSGKSAGLNSLISSLLYRCTPRELKLLMVDPKKVELSLYEGIPHLAAPVITDVKQAPAIFKQAVREMETRYDRFAKAQTRNIEGYNSKVAEEDKLPYWVLIVDELADLMMTAGPEIEQYICRLAQLARATGIHLVIATQRPSVNVITGTIKANISSRIAFAVNSAVDSRTILDSVGADRLIGRGDMLFMPMDASKPTRIQGCYISEEETHALVEFLRQQDTPQYEVLPSTLALATSEAETPNDEVDDDLFESAVRLVVSGGSASTSMLQRRFKIGYTRAARLVDIMEQRGIVGQLDGAKPREILISRDEVESMFGGGTSGTIPLSDSDDEE